MANFNTHLGFACTGTAIFSSISVVTGLASPTEGFLLWLIGTLGGLLPDVDSNQSSSLRIVFNIIALFICILFFFQTYQKINLPYIWLGILSIYVSLRFIALPLFKRHTKHRGNWHSIMTCVLVSMSLTAICWHTLKLNGALSWLAGIALGLGFFLHLLLDELFALDFSGARTKQSFGSAMKLCSIKYPKGAISVSLMLTVVSYTLPPVDELQFIISKFATL